MVLSGSPFGCSAVLAGLPLLLVFLQPILGLGHVNGSVGHTYDSVVHAESEISGTAGDSRTAESPLEKGSDGAYPWEATCGSYKSVTLRFPELHARATYDLKQVVQGAPPMGWTCKASEPLFELEEYPPFFQGVLSIMFGINEDSSGKRVRNKLHKHKDKHVFFSFNPCRLLPHTCHGSRGRLFKFAAKLKKPNNPQEEIDRLLADLLKVPASSSSPLAEGDKRAEEEADTTECLQNVLSTNTTLLYSYRDETMQQHPDSNGIGGLWAEPEITDDPTPWEPLNANDPFEGLQAHMHHVHIFCPDSSLHTHVILKCPKPEASGGPGAVAANAASATKFELCEHSDPCKFSMVLTTPAACPILVDYSGTEATRSLASFPLLSGNLLLNADTEMKNKTNTTSLASSGQPATKQQNGAPTPAPATEEKHLPSLFSKQESSISSSLHKSPSANSASGGKSHDGGFWELLPRVLLLCLRIFLCLLVFAWMIYAIRDWKDKNMQYAPFPGEKSEEEAAAALGNVNSYDSCVRALAGMSSNPTRATDTEGFQLAATYTTGSPTATNAGAGDAAFVGSAAAKPPRRELRGLYSSRSRRFVTVWLPQAIEFSTRQVVAFSEVAVSACKKLKTAFNPTRGAAGKFVERDSVGSGTPWDWTNTLDFNDTETQTSTDIPSREVLSGLSGYETIS